MARDEPLSPKDLNEVNTVDSARLNMIVPVATKRALERLAKRYAVTQRDAGEADWRFRAGALAGLERIERFEFSAAVVNGQHRALIDAFRCPVLVYGDNALPARPDVVVRRLMRLLAE